jgi:hypothetical protein
VDNEPEWQQPGGIAGSPANHNTNRWHYVSNIEPARGAPLHIPARLHDTDIAGTVDANFGERPFQAPPPPGYKSVLEIDIAEALDGWRERIRSRLTFQVDPMLTGPDQARLQKLLDDCVTIELDRMIKRALGMPKSDAAEYAEARQLSLIDAFRCDLPAPHPASPMMMHTPAADAKTFQTIMDRNRLLPLRFQPGEPSNVRDRDIHPCDCGFLESGKRCNCPKAGA